MDVDFNVEVGRIIQELINQNRWDIIEQYAMGQPPNACMFEEYPPPPPNPFTGLLRASAGIALSEHRKGLYLVKP